MLKAYIASPFFNDRERTLVKELETLLPNLGIDTYSPSRDGIILKPDSDSKSRMEVLEENKRAIHECDFVLANTDGDSLKTILPDKVLVDLLAVLNRYRESYWIGNKEFSAIGRLVSRDPGTYWELGYAHAIGKHIITYSQYGFDVNVMIGESCVAHTKSWDELKEALMLFKQAATLTPLRGTVVKSEYLLNPYWSELQKKFKRDYKVF